tara:strand:+ start:2064 stop:2423 length:360 start_codon:yes stop_codon:yes gene_type:complete
LEFEYALLMFASGVASHAFLIRILGLWSKSLLYKLTFINCLAILRLCENTSKEMLKAASPDGDRSIDIIFKYWHTMALHSLKNVIPDVVWKDISVDDWAQAMKILSAIEKGVEENEETK